MDHREFWEQMHVTGNERYLTNSVLRDYDRHKPFAKVRKGGLKVMEIGVGFGQCVQEMVKWGNEVYAVDIAPTALDRVKHLCKEVCPTGYLDAWDVRVDVVICHLVLCHTDVPMTEFLLHQAMLHLTEKGVASFHFGVRIGPLSEDFRNEEALGVMFHYHPNEILRMLQKIGAQNIEFNGTLNMNGLGWDFVQFSR